MKKRMSGFDELQKDLNKLQKKMEKINETQAVPLVDILTDDFMQNHTRFSSFDEFMNASSWTVDSVEDFDAIPVREMDRYVATCSTFSSWEEMFGKAGELYAVKQLGF